MAGQHRIDRALQRLVPLKNGPPQLVVEPVRPQPLELVMQVEDDGGMLETPRLATGVGMQAHGEERLSAERQRKVWAVRRRGHARVVVVTVPNVLVGKRLEPRP